MKDNMIKQISKFLVVGGIATIIDWFVYYLLYNLLKINPLIANIISFTISVIYNYIASVKWVFNVNKEKSKKSMFWEFMIFSIIGLIITEVLLYCFIEKININGMISKIIATAIVMVFNFITRKIFLEKDIDYKKLLKNEKVVGCLNLFFSLCFVYGYNYYFFKNNILGRQSIFNFIVLFFIYNFFKKTKTDGKEFKVPKILGIIFAISLVVGHVVYETNSIEPLYNSFKSILINLFSLIGFGKFFSLLCCVLFLKITKIEKKLNKKMWKFYNLKHIYWILTGIFFGSHIPAFLAYYPGIFSCDMNAQTKQIFTDAITKWHPPIHTFFWEFCLMLGEKINIDALIIYTFIQVLFLSLVFAKVCKFLINHKINNYIILFSVLFFSINPIITLYTMVTTKDVFFAGFFLLWILELIDMILNSQQYFKNYKNWLKFIFFGLMTCLFRNNAIYVIILCLPFLLYVFKYYWKQLCLMFLIIIGSYYFIQNGVYNYLGIKDGNNKEMLSVPIQQIANVAYNHDQELDDETKDEINKFIPYKDIFLYNPRFADPVKSPFKTNYFNSNKMEFIKLWTNLLVKYPSNYVSAFLALNIHYWYIDADTIDKYSKRAYIEDYFYKIDYYTTTRDSKLPWLYKIYHKIANYKLFERLPLISTLFSITIVFWLIMVTFFILIYKKDKKLIISLLPMLFLWLTHMAGPVSVLRYVFALYCCYPILITLIFQSKNLKIKSEM